MKEFFSMNKPFKKYLPIYMITLSIVLLMGTSYALLRSSHQGENTYTMNVGTLQVTFVDSKTSALTLENAYPMTDDEGMKNSAELVFTVKNTGNVAAKYSVYIEETSTNPEFKSVIRFISNKNDTGYTDPKTLASDKYIDDNGTLSVGAEATYKVKAWISSDADSTYMNKTFTARIVVESVQSTLAVDKIKSNLISKNTDICKTYDEENGTFYVKNSNDCVDFNYVWYSGKMWRIVSVNQDGTMKIITDNDITTIAYGANHRFYDIENNFSSYVYQFLNEDFLDTLYNHENIIVEDSTWNMTSTTDPTIEEPTPLQLSDSKIINKSIIGKNTPVGLLNVYEFSKTFLGEEIYFKTWLLDSDYNETISVENNILNYLAAINDGGYSYVGDGNCNESYGIKPVVNLVSDIKFTSGDGTKNNPYRISGDKTPGNSNELLNTRLSGEYIKFDNELYRITEVNNDLTKVIKVNLLKENNQEVIKKFGTTNKYSSGTTSDYFMYYLNNTWYNTLSSKQMIIKGNYYINEVTASNSIIITNPYYEDPVDYKNGICLESYTKNTTKTCTKTNNTWNGYIGLPRYGEMFATMHESTTNYIGFITPSDSSNNIWGISETEGYFNIGSTDDIVVYPMFYLLSTIKITGGTGLENDPYTIG